MTSVEGDGITGHEAAHDLTQRGRPGAHEEVKMIRDKRPRIALCLGFFEDSGQAIKEGVAVLVVSEKLPSFNSPGHDVL